MEISPEQADRLFNFRGYGNLEAPYWFIGMEEGTSGKDAIEANLRIRIERFDEVMDLHVAHDSQHLNWPICEQTRYPSVWVFMAKIIASLKGENDWQDTRKAKTYICENLGRADGETFLTEMLPLPKPSAGSWPQMYKNLFAKREQYEAKVRSYRAVLLNQLAQRYSPKYIFCYGETHYVFFKAIADISSDTWKTVEGTKIQVGRSEKTQFILTPFLGNGRIGNAALQTLFNYLKQ